MRNREIFRRHLLTLFLLVLLVLSMSAKADNTLYSTSTSGTWTYTVPPGVYSVQVIISGAGGGGGGADGTSISVSSGSSYGGNGGAGSALTSQLNVTPGQILSGIVGTGGGGGIYGKDLAGGFSGAGAGNGGNGDGASTNGLSGGGGGGGGGTSLLLGGVTVLHAGGGGGGGGGSGNFFGLSGLTSTSLTAVANCGNAGNGGHSGFAQVDGGGGGGGGGGYVGGLAGSDGIDFSAYASGGGGGSSCYGLSISAIVGTPTLSIGSQGGSGSSDTSVSGGLGNNGSVTIINIPGAPGNYWSGTTSSTWNLTDNNWVNNPAPGISSGLWANTGTAVFGSTNAQPGNVNVSATQNITTILFNSSSASYVLNGGTLNATGPLTIANIGTSTAIINSPLIVSTNSLRLSGTGSITLGGLIDNGASSASITNDTAMIWAGSARQVLSGNITGSGNLSIASNNTLTLSGKNTYTGITVLSQGTLNLAGTLGTFISVNGGLLTGTGSNAGSLIVNSGGVLSPGSGGIGSLSMGTTSLNSGAVFNATVGSSQNQLNVSGNLTLGGTLNVTLNAGVPTGSYTIATYTGALNGSFSNIVAPSGYLSTINTQTPGTVKLTLFGLLKLNNTWGLGSTTGDIATITTAGALLDASVSSSATTTGNTTSGSTVGNIQPGQTIILPAPTISPSLNYANYSIAVSCNNSSNLATSVFPARFTLTPADVTNGVTCTYTESPKSNTVSGIVLLDNGTGGGIANDGIQNGAETGIPGVTITLTNCSATTFSTTVTNGAGQFRLTVPTGTTGSMCIVKTPRAGFVAVSSNVGTTGGTYNAATDTLTFNAIASTNYGSIVLGEVNQSTFTGNASKTVAINGAVTYAHVYNAGNAASVLFTTSDAQNLPNQNWRSVIYRDATCSGSLASNPTIITAPISVKAGDQICLLINVTSAPNATNNTVNTTTITATETYTPQPTIGVVKQTFTLINTTSVGTSNLSLTKQLRVVSACPANANQSTLNVSDIYATEINATPGQFVQYLITYTNASASPMTKLVVYDQIPAYTLFVNAFCVALPTSGISSCAVTTSPNVGGTGGVTWSMTDSPGATSGAQGGLNSGGKGSVSYCVQIQQ